MNKLLKPIAERYTTIRRLLVDHVFLNQHIGVYSVSRGHRGAGDPTSGG